MCSDAVVAEDKCNVVEGKEGRWGEEGWGVEEGEVRFPPQKNALSYDDGLQGAQQVHAGHAPSQSTVKRFSQGLLRLCCEAAARSARWFPEKAKFSSN